MEDLDPIIQKEFLEEKNLHFKKQFIKFLRDPVEGFIFFFSLQQNFFKKQLGLSMDNRKYRLKTYPNCFIAQNAISFLVEK